MGTWLERLNQELVKYKTMVTFSENALSDFKSFDQHTKKIVLALLLNQAKRGAQFKPDGNGIRLTGELFEFAKIKRTHTSLRVVYRPIENKDFIEMQILAIGPRDKDKVYTTAKKRLHAFYDELGR